MDNISNYTLMKKIILLFIFVGLFSCKKENDHIHFGSISVLNTSELTEAQELLEGKTEITGFVQVNGQTNPDLSFLENIERIGGRLRLTENTITNLSSLSNLTSIEGPLEISGNTIESLAGLENLTNVESLVIDSNNPDLVIDAVANVAVSRGFSIRDFDTEIPVFPNVKNIEALLLFDLSNITDISFLPNLTTVSDDIYISNNDQLESLEGLNSITELAWLNVHDNDALTDLSALTNMDNVTKISMYYNTQLTDYCPLKTAVSNYNLESAFFSENLENPTKEEIISDCP